MDGSTEAETSLPASVDAYIADMLEQLATLAASRGRAGLAERIRQAANEAVEPA